MVVEEWSLGQGIDITRLYQILHSDKMVMWMAWLGYRTKYHAPHRETEPPFEETETHLDFLAIRIHTIAARSQSWFIREGRPQ